MSNILIDFITNFKEKGWKIFLANLLAMFLMVSLPKLALVIFPEFNSSLGIVSPLPAKENIFNQIKPLLEEKVNNFKLKKESNSLVPEVSATADYEEASGYVVVDLLDGMVIASKNSDKRIPIASITKVMTAVVALDLASEEELFEPTDKASNMIPTKLVLDPGEKYSLKELISGALLVSANDCAEVIKEGIDQKYGEEVFIKAMNEKAKALGLKDTHFTNAQGFDNPMHYSTPEDVAIFSQYALANYPLIAELVKQEYGEIIKTPLHKYHYLNNWNGLIGVYPGTYGVKIGNTDDAGKTTSVVAEREGHNLLVVLLGAPGVLERDLWAAELFDLGFAKRYNLAPVEIKEEKLKEKYATFKYFK